MLTSLRQELAKVRTEVAEKNAVARALRAKGYRRAPEVTAGKTPDRRVVRMYLWRDTPLGNLCLTTGPSVEGELYELFPHTGGEKGAVYFPAKSGRPALSQAKAPSRIPGDPFDFESFVADRWPDAAAEIDVLSQRISNPRLNPKEDHLRWVIGHDWVGEGHDPGFAAQLVEGARRDLARLESTPAVRATLDTARDAREQARFGRRYRAGFSREILNPQIGMFGSRPPVQSSQSGDFALVPAEGDRVRLAHLPSGDWVAELWPGHMAEHALKVAAELGPNIDNKWIADFEKGMNRAARVVACPTCPAGVGEPCVRPSEHRTWGEKPHAARRTALEKWLLQSPARNPHRAATAKRKIKAALRQIPREKGQHPASGLCYPASEAFYHAVGGKAAGYTPMQLKHEGVSHWWVRGPKGEVYDLTEDQFKGAVPHGKSRGRGFLTSEPSERAEILLEAAGLRRGNPQARVGKVRTDAKTGGKYVLWRPVLEDGSRPRIYLSAEKGKEDAELVDVTEASLQLEASKRAVEKKEKKRP